MAQCTVQRFMHIFASSFAFAHTAQTCTCAAGTHINSKAADTRHRTQSIGPGGGGQAQRMS